jgi:hypothetical protein
VSDTTIYGADEHQLKGLDVINHWQQALLGKLGGDSSVRPLNVRTIPTQLNTSNACDPTKSVAQTVSPFGSEAGAPHSRTATVNGRKTYRVSGWGSAQPSENYDGWCVQNSNSIIGVIAVLFISLIGIAHKLQKQFNSI